MLKFTIAVLALAFLPSILAKQCGEKAAPTCRIVGGVNACENEFPWQVSWQFFNLTTGVSRHICGGSILSDKYVLTAAHCVDLFDIVNPAEFRAVVGAHSQSSPSKNQKVMKVKAIDIHPGWDSKQIINDVAVVELEEEIGLENSELNAICLGSPQHETENRGAIISGWGKISQDATTIPDILQMAEVKVEKQSTCKSIYSIIKPLSDGEVCAGKNPGGCNGDSGGPLQYQINGRWYQLGIASWVVRCGHTTFPTVWARVPYFLDFITAKSGISPPGY